MSGSLEEPSAIDSPEAFYEAAGDGFESSVLTRGPWDGASQHAGPPAALVGRAIERCAGIGESVTDRHVARVTFEILRPVPIARLRVEAEVVRPGRRVDMVEATLTDDAGEPLVRARGWRMLRREIELPPGFGPDASEPPAPPESAPVASEFFPTGYDVGYHTAMEYRFVTGSFVAIGPATTWMRMRVPLVAGEEPTPLQRVPRRGRQRQRHQLGPRLPLLRLHQRRPDRPPASPPGRRVGLPRLDHGSAAERRRHDRHVAARRSRTDRPRRPEPAGRHVARRVASA